MPARDGGDGLQGGGDDTRTHATHRRQAMLYYEKSTTRNMGTGRLPQVPVQLETPTGGMLIGSKYAVEEPIEHEAHRLPKEVALVSCASNASFDELSRRKLQAQFIGLAVLNVILSSVLLFRPNGDPSLIDARDPNGPGAGPSQFENVRRSAVEAYIGLYAGSLIILGFGAASVVKRVPLGIKLYTIAAFLNMVYGAIHVPYIVYFSRYIIDGIMIFVAEKLYSKLVPSWLLVTGRRYP